MFTFKSAIKITEDIAVPMRKKACNFSERQVDGGNMSPNIAYPTFRENKITKVNRSQCDATQRCRNVEIENGETGVGFHKRNTVLAVLTIQSRQERGDEYAKLAGEKYRECKAG